jgi:hypothetical protein
MNKNLVLTLFLLIILLYSAYSLEMGINPAYLSLEGKTEEKVCQNISVYADRDINMTIKDRWTNIDGSRKIKDYNLSSEELGLEVASIEKLPISANETKEIVVCFSGENAGNFYGAVLFESDNGYASIGSWINLKITGSQKNNLLPLAGAAIGANKNNFLLIGLLCLIPEIIMIFFLIRRKRKSSEFSIKDKKLNNFYGDMHKKKDL